MILTYVIYHFVIGRIHGAMVAATGRSDRRGDCFGGDDCRDDRRDSRLVYTQQAIVAATIAVTIAPCIRPITDGRYMSRPFYLSACG